MEKFALFGFFAPILLFFQQSRNFLVSIFRIVWKRRVVESFCNQFYNILYKNSLLVPLDNYIIGSTYVGIKSKKQYCTVLGKKFHFQIFLWKKIFPVFVYGTEQGFIVNYLAFTFPFEKIVTESYNEKLNYLATQSEFSVVDRRGVSLKSQMITESHKSSSPSYSPSSQDNAPIISLDTAIANNYAQLFGFKCDDVSNLLPRDDNNKYVFTKVGKEVLAEVKKWRESREWYDKRNIPWKRGILIHSLPGMGKSSLILEVAKELRLQLNVFDLSTMDNEEFSRQLENCYFESIILLEDFERIFEKDKNILKSNEFGGLTFDCVLNKLSGVNARRNVFFFITVNDISKVDAALLRPGRVDRIIELPPMDREEKRMVANVILKDNPEMIEDVLIDSDGLSNADFENRCIKKALNIFWK